MRWATYNRLMDRLVAADGVADERLVLLAANDHWGVLGKTVKSMLRSMQRPNRQDKGWEPIATLPRPLTGAETRTVWLLPRAASLHTRHDRANAAAI
jgi:hypothetical protein